MIRVYCMGMTKPELRRYLIDDMNVPASSIQDSGEEDQLHVYFHDGSDEAKLIKKLQGDDHDYLKVRP